MENLGEKLFELRKSKNLTQDDVAEKLNVTRQTVSKWETNQSTPDFDKIVPLCDLYEITPNELLSVVSEESTNERHESFEFDFGEAKKHLFTRGKDDDEVDYEKMTASQIKQKSAKVVSTSVFIYIAAVAFIMIAIPVQRMNPIVASSIFLLLIGWATARIIKHYMSVPKLEKTEKDKKQDRVAKQINEIINCICVAIYFILSFVTMAWHVTWVIFIIMGCIDGIVKLVFMLKEGDRNEE